MMRILSTAYNSIIREHCHHHKCSRHHHHHHHNVIVNDIEEDEEYHVDAQGEETASFATTVQEGDIVTLELSLVPENGFIPEPLFDTSGQVSFVLGWGNYLPGLHQLVLQACNSGKVVVKNVSIDAGWGSRRQDLLFTVSKENLIRQNIISNIHDEIQPGSWLRIPQAAQNNNGSFTSSSSNTVQVLADQVTDDVIVLDANPPLAGSSYSCSFRVLSIDPLPSNLDMVTVVQQKRVHDDDDDDIILSKETTTTTTNPTTTKSIIHPNVQSNNNKFQVATFALGCFWGAELAFARQVGVVGTLTGYSQGTTRNPTYQQVCNGMTKHRECVLVIYNYSQVSYLQLLNVALQRLDQTMTTTTNSNNNTSFIMFHEDENDVNNIEYPSQYKPGFYYHTEEQYETARTFLEQQRQRRNRTTAIELLPARTFYNAEEYHQQYLFKGGQSTRKGAKEIIRCYG